jgi:hypothetical protein
LVNFHHELHWSKKFAGAAVSRSHAPVIASWGEVFYLVVAAAYQAVKEHIAELFIAGNLKTIPSDTW